MIRTMTAAIFGGAMALSAAQAKDLRSATEAAQTAQAGVQLAQADAPVPRRRISGRLRITPNRDYWPADVYPRYDPGPNAVRVCNATYVQEYRPSGTVIVPRVACVWRPG